MELSHLTINDVKPYELNAKLHPKEQIQKLADVVKIIGWRQPALVNQKGVIVVGHGRWLVWEEFKKVLPPIWIIDDTGKTVHGGPDPRPLTPEQETWWRIADNGLNLATGFNMDLIMAEVRLMPPEIQRLTGLDEKTLLNPDSLGDSFTLDSGEKGTLEQITFTLSSEQALLIREALAKAQNAGIVLEEFGNTNKNGNAIYAIVKEWEQKI